VNSERIESQIRTEKKMVECEDIQPLLFDYMSRELGEGRAAIVREHLRKCRNCQILAKDMQAAVDLLHKTSKAGSGSPERLSENRRKKIIWAFTHPIISWIYKNIFIFSIIGALIVILTVWMFSKFLIERRFAPLQGEPITVIIVNHGQTNVVIGDTNILKSVDQQ